MHIFHDDDIGGDVGLLLLTMASKAHANGTSVVRSQTLSEVSSGIFWCRICRSYSNSINSGTSPFEDTLGPTVCRKHGRQSYVAESAR